MRLEGHTALITGGTQGVGAAIAISLAKAGCDLILHGLQDDEHAQRSRMDCREQGVWVECVHEDLSGPSETCIASLLSKVDTVLEKGGSRRVDILVNNAGTFCDRPFLEMDVGRMERTFRLNVLSGYFLTQRFSRRWIDEQVRGRVLFTGSINGILAEPDHTAYDASKGAVHAMVRSLCVALAPHGIRVNGMAPGLVITPLTAPVLQPGSDALSWMKLHTPNGQVPGPEVCGPAAVFLLSDEAEHVQGQVLLVDGGMSIWQQPDMPLQLSGKLA